MSPGGAPPPTVPVGVQPEELLHRRAGEDGEHAPGHMVVDRRLLPFAAHEGDDRERAVGLDVDRP
jgi:hypothetical protein